MKKKRPKLPYDPWNNMKWLKDIIIYFEGEEAFNRIRDHWHNHTLHFGDITNYFPHLKNQFEKYVEECQEGDLAYIIDLMYRYYHSDSSWVKEQIEKCNYGTVEKVITWFNLYNSTVFINEWKEQALLSHYKRKYYHNSLLFVALV